MSSTQQITRELRELSHRLLDTGEVELVIGWGPGSLAQTTRPLFALSAEETAGLVWNRWCTNNLVVYLSRPEVRRLGRPAVVVKGCDARALTVLIQENQVQREQLVVIGVGCDGVDDGRGEVLAKCTGCQVRTPGLCDHLVGVEVAPASGRHDGAAVEGIEQMSREQRRQYWQEALAACTRCYACRAVCPLCYCESCFVDQTRPAWTSHAHTGQDLFVYHLFRAFHLTGRCVGCGECARVCPQQIPIDLLNQKMGQEVAEQYGFIAGLDVETGSPMLTFNPDDPEEFIR